MPLAFVQSPPGAFAARQATDPPSAVCEALEVGIPAVSPTGKTKGADLLDRPPFSLWRARQDSNPRPLGS